MIHLTRIKSFLLPVAMMLTAAAPAVAQSAEYKLNVQNFSELTVVDGINVDYYCRPDSAGWAVFSCTPEVAAEIMFTNDADHLTIRTAAEEHTLADMPEIRVYSASLHKVENSGDSLVRVFTDVPVDKFKARVIGNGILEIHGVKTDNFDAGLTAGNGHLIVDGKAKKVKINNVGTGPVEASDLISPNISCFVFGTGDIECTPLESLRVYGAGSGKVRYHGTPSKVTLRGIGVKAVACDEPKLLTEN